MTLNFIQGISFSGRFVAQDDNGYINLSGFLTSGQVQYKHSSISGLFNLNPSINNSYISGIIDISVPANILQNSPIGSFYYYINIYDGQGYVSRIIDGNANVGTSLISCNC